MSTAGGPDQEPGAQALQSFHTFPTEAGQCPSARQPIVRYSNKKPGRRLKLHPTPRTLDLHHGTPSYEPRRYVQAVGPTDSRHPAQHR